MCKLENERHEAFAQARARGAKIGDAYLDAGYKGRPNAWRMNKIKAVSERIAELRHDLRWGGSPDLSPVINLLGKAAEQAVALNTAASLAAARGLLVEVAKLKMRLAETIERTPRSLQLAPRLTDEQWLEKHVPKQ